MRLFDMDYVKEKHVNEKVFMVGNGPSLTYGMLDRLQNHNTIAMNNISVAFPHTKWRPTYYLNVSRSFRFDPHWRKMGMEGINQSGHTFLWAINATIPATEGSDARVSVLSCHTMPIWSKDPQANVSRYGTSMFSALHLADWMGFNPIFLIGCDLNYSEGADFKNKRDNFHFSDEYFGEHKSDRLDKHRLAVDEIRTFDSHTIANVSLRKKGVRVYTCSPGPLQSIYEYVSFDDALNMKTAWFSEEVMNTAERRE